jgi:hypothetical protein
LLLTIRRRERRTGAGGERIGGFFGEVRVRGCAWVFIGAVERGGGNGGASSRVRLETDGRDSGRAEEVGLIRGIGKTAL